jgi:hypothetical protein
VVWEDPQEHVQAYDAKDDHEAEMEDVCDAQREAEDHT